MLAAFMPHSYTVTTTNGPFAVLLSDKCFFFIYYLQLILKNTYFMSVDGYVNQAVSLT